MATAATETRGPTDTAGKTVSLAETGGPVPLPSDKECEHGFQKQIPTAAPVASPGKQRKSTKTASSLAPKKSSPPNPDDPTTWTDDKTGDLKWIDKPLGAAVVKTKVLGMAIGLCILSFLIGYYSFSVMFVVIPIGIAFVMYKERENKLRMFYRIEAERRHARMRVGRDVETVEWMNNLVEQFWWYLEPSICQMTREIVEPILAEQLPPGMQSIKFETLKLGKAAPFIRSMKVDTSASRHQRAAVPSNARPDPKWLQEMSHDRAALEIEAGFSAPEAQIVVRVTSKAKVAVSAAVKEVHFFGRMRVELQFNQVFPHVQSVDFRFLEAPEINLDLIPLKAGFVSADFPGLDTLVTKIAGDVIQDMLLDPRSLNIDLRALLGSPKFHNLYKCHNAVVLIEVVSIEGRKLLEDKLRIKVKNGLQKRVTPILEAASEDVLEVGTVFAVLAENENDVLDWEIKRQRVAMNAEVIADGKIPLTRVKRKPKDSGATPLGETAGRLDEPVDIVEYIASSGSIVAAPARVVGGTMQDVKRFTTTLFARKDKTSNQGAGEEPVAEPKVSLPEGTKGAVHFRIIYHELPLVRLPAELVAEQAEATNKKAAELKQLETKWLQEGTILQHQEELKRKKEEAAKEKEKQKAEMAENPHLEPHLLQLVRLANVSNVTSGVLTLVLHEARGLKAMDRGGTSDPFCEIDVKTRTRRFHLTKTKTITKEINPSWELHRDVLIADYKTTRVKFSVYDEDTFTNNELIGSVDLNLAKIFKRTTKSLFDSLGQPIMRFVKERIWVSLEDESSTSQQKQDVTDKGLGKLCLSFVFRPYLMEFDDVSDDKEDDEKTSRGIVGGGVHGVASGVKKITKLGGRGAVGVAGALGRKEKRLAFGDTGTLAVSIIRAENVKAMDSNGLSDPFAVVKIGDRQILRTKTVYKSLAPEWNEQCSGEIYDRYSEQFRVEVYDSDKLGAQTIGSLILPLSDPSTLKGEAQWLTLLEHGTKGSETGKILLSVEWRDGNEEGAAGTQKDPDEISSDEEELDESALGTVPPVANLPDTRVKESGEGTSEGSSTGAASGAAAPEPEAVTSPDATERHRALQSPSASSLQSPAREKCLVNVKVVLLALKNVPEKEQARHLYVKVNTSGFPGSGAHSKTFKPEGPEIQLNETFPFESINLNKDKIYFEVKKDKAYAPLTGRLAHSGVGRGELPLRNIFPGHDSDTSLAASEEKSWSLNLGDENPPMTILISLSISPVASKN